jgi:hypothetical protein
MGDKITREEVDRATQLGPRWCAPIKTLLRGFEERLPADQVLTIATELSVSSAYIPPDSPLGDYYIRTLRGFGEALKGAGIRPEFFREEYEPAISYFEKQRKNRRAIKLSCNNSPYDVTPPYMLPLPPGKAGGAWSCISRSAWASSSCRRRRRGSSTGSS